MIELESLLVFLGAVLVLAITPGPDMLYIIARGAGQGRRAGVVSALGVGVGILVHTAIAALGLSALLQASAYGFEVVKFLGAGYLIYLGIRMLLAREEVSLGERLASTNLGKIFGQAVVTNILNPKVALFFIAFLPQFVNPATGSTILQFLVYGSLITLFGTAINLLIALASGFVDTFLKQRRSFVKVQRWATGGIFIALGLRLATLDIE